MLRTQWHYRPKFDPRATPWRADLPSIKPNTTNSFDLNFNKHLCSVDWVLGTLMKKWTHCYRKHYKARENELNAFIGAGYLTLVNISIHCYHILMSWLENVNVGSNLLRIIHVLHFVNLRGYRLIELCYIWLYMYLDG